MSQKVSSNSFRNIIFLHLAHKINKLFFSELKSYIFTIRLIFNVRFEDEILKAFQVTDFEKNPTIEHIQTPDPKPDQIRLKIMSCGLNFADILLKNGTYQETPALPFVLGMEVSGVVDVLGSNVTNFSVGASSKLI